jgi:hypothetical protein
MGLKRKIAASVAIWVAGFVVKRIIKKAERRK